MKQRANTDPRSDVYFVTCSNCNYRLECGKAPIKAERLAARHSRRFPGHAVTVLNLTRLTEHAKYFHVPLELDNEPPF